MTTKLTTRTRLLLGLLALALMGAAAGRVTSTITNADQRTRSPAHARAWGMSWSDRDFKILKADNGATSSASNTEEQFFLYDAQVAVSCSDRKPATAHRSAAMFCWLQAETATISMGPAYSGTPTIYNLGEGAGRISATTVASPTAPTEGQGACFTVPSGTGPIFSMVPSTAFRNGTAHPYRTGACSNGRPCRVSYSSVDCAVDSTTCSTSNTITGVYLGGTVTSTTIDCVVMEAM